jgi:hypothetical protein
MNETVLWLMGLPSFQWTIIGRQPEKREKRKLERQNGKVGGKKAGADFRNRQQGNNSRPCY